MQPVPKQRLLLVEDDETTRTVLGQMLQRWNFRVEVADTGDKVFEMAVNARFDLILMDLNMPFLDGISATRAIRERDRCCGSHTPIIAMTASTTKKEKETCIKSGIDAYVTKPIHFRHLVKTIEKVVGSGEGVS